ncbi:hypothetical protein SRHO_G00123840 [Serrasalmus rhombeus]
MRNHGVPGHPPPGGAWRGQASLPSSLNGRAIHQGYMLGYTREKRSKSTCPCLRWDWLPTQGAPCEQNLAANFKPLFLRNRFTYPHGLGLSIRTTPGLAS